MRADGRRRRGTAIARRDGNTDDYSADVMPNVRPRRRDTTLTAAALLSVALISACSSSPGGGGTADPARDDSVVEVTVPALWADTGRGLSGIEPAKVRVDTEGDGDFAIDLADIEAQGAGDSWRAASASAAVVGTMVSGVSPAGVDIDFAVTGAINGPSAGGILTVAIMAALLERPLRSDMTMTGTITADGSLGKIGGVELKLKAAADAGYRTVLLPPSNATVRRSDTGSDVSAVALGAELGVEVIIVPDIQQAFALFSDSDFAYPELPAYELPATVLEAARANTQRQIASIENDLAAAPSAVASDANLTSALAKVTDAFDRGDLATAYGLGVDTLLTVRRRVADDRWSQRVTADGPVGTARALRDEGQTVADRARTAVDEALDEAVSMGYEQMLSVISALGWPVYALGALQALDDELARASSSPDLTAAARLVSDMATNLDVHFPDAMAVVRAMPTRAVADPAVMAEYLSIYSDFLMRAAQANEVYVSDVLLGVGDLRQAADQRQVFSLLPIVVAMGDEAAAAVRPGVGTLREELEQAAYSFTYYLGVVSLLAALQSFGIDDFRFANEAIYVATPAALDASVKLAKFAVDEVAKFLATQNIDAGYAVWSARWGDAAYQALSAGGRGGVGAVLALEELWFDALNVFMMRTGPVASAS